MGKSNPVTRPISWRRALFGGLASVGLVAAVACSATTDSGDAAPPPSTIAGVAATESPVAATMATRNPIATATRAAAPTGTGAGPTPTLRVAPTPTRILRATATPFVPAAGSLFATSTPIPRIQATVVRPTPTRFVAPTAIPFTGGSSSSGSGSVPTPTPGARSEGETRVSGIQDFELESFTISVGTTVTWTNLDSVPHTSTSGISPNFDGAFDSSALSQNGKFSHTFNSPGAFPDFCSIHTFMTAVITVQ